MLLKHYGAIEYIPSKVGRVKNSDYKNKPAKGGIWTSPIDSNYGWKEWTTQEEYGSGVREDLSFIVRLNMDAKVMRIDSLKDLEIAIRDYENYDKITKHEKTLDYERIALYYDAIWLTEKGQEETRLTHPFDLYGWDCESVLIFNPNCIEQVKIKQPV